MTEDSRVWWIWLQQALPLGHPAADLVLRGSLRPREIYEADGKRLEELGFPAECRAALADKSLDRAKRIFRLACAGGDWLLTPDDAYFPQRLREIVGGPLALYCRGEMPDLNALPAFGVVGTRHASESGRLNAACLGAGLAAGGMVVVSGGAVGIDGAAHFGAVRAGGRTIVVKAGSLDDLYPEENEGLRREIVQSGGLLVSEFPPGSKSRCDFHVRNRLISGMSVGVCLVEAPGRSGALITATLAREQGRDVYAMPGDIPSHLNDGAHRRIQEGALLATRAEDILSDYLADYPGMLDLEAAAKAQEAMAAFLIRKGRRESGHPQPKGRSGKASRKSAAASAKPEGPVTGPEAPASSPQPAPLPETVSAGARRIHGALERAPLPLEQLAETAGLPVAAALVALTELELCGCARSHAGQQYSL